MTSEREQRDHEVELSERTRIPLGIAISTIIAFLGGAIWLNNSLNRIDARLALIESGTRDRFTGRDMRMWVLQFRLDNPTIKVPEVIVDK